LRQLINRLALVFVLGVVVNGSRWGVVELLETLSNTNGKCVGSLEFFGCERLPQELFNHALSLLIDVLKHALIHNCRQTMSVRKGSDVVFSVL
jgi:hypothetical protein